MDDGATARADGGFKVWRVLQHFEVVLVGAVVHVQLGLDVLPAFAAGFPIPLVTLCVVEPAQGVAAVIAMAAILGIGKELVVLLVVADPLPAAFRLHESRPLPAEEALLGWGCLRLWTTWRSGFRFGLCGHGD